MAAGQARAEAEADAGTETGPPAAHQDKCSELDVKRDC